MKTCILYARVSTQEQAQRGYSLRQQIEALRAHAETEGFEVLDEIEDPGQSGASLERPGLDRVRDLVGDGGVSVVLGQDRDRFAREPAFLYLLKVEFAEHGCRLRALNDRGDDSPEGQLTDGILDQLAKFERAKTAERTRRGKIRKAHEGKLVAGHTPNYGFRYTEARDGYLVDEEQMRVVRRIFELVASGTPIYSVKRTLEHEGVPSPPKPKQRDGGGEWSKKTIRDMIFEDVYRPHSYGEIEALVKSEVAARLDQERSYGVWFFNRRRTKVTPVSEPGPNGRSYRRRQSTVEKPRDQWVAVPVPDSGIPPALVNAARDRIKDNRPTPPKGLHFYELSHGIMVCGECGSRMVANGVLQPRTKKPAFYYRCPTRQHRGKDVCSNGKHFRAEKVEEAVWRGMVKLMGEPKELIRMFDRLIEQERRSVRGNPDREMGALMDGLAALDRRRTGYLDLAADALMSREELRGKLAELDDARAAIDKELEAARSRGDRVRELESWRDAVWMWAHQASELMRWDGAPPEERHALYRRYRITVTAAPDGEVSMGGPLVERSSIVANTPSSR